jgi:small subunit ribosomal protein S16
MFGDIMSVMLRLARGGQKKRPFYRIVVTKKAARRDGKFIEVIGNYNPMTEPATVNLREDRVKHWLSVGAQPSDKVSEFIIKQIPGHLEAIRDGRVKKTQAKRTARKQRAAARAA